MIFKQLQGHTESVRTGNAIEFILCQRSKTIDLRLKGFIYLVDLSGSIVVFTFFM